MNLLLKKTRAINKLLQKSAGHTVDFNEVANVLSDSIGASIYILDRRGKVLGYTYLKGWTCDIMKDIVEGLGGFPEDYDDVLDIGGLSLQLIFPDGSTYRVPWVYASDEFNCDGSGAGPSEIEALSGSVTITLS